MHNINILLSEMTEAPVSVPQQEAPPSQEVLWQRVKQNRDDFESWTQLADIAEKEEDVNMVVPVFDQFLPRFPLLYGYWKRYAEFMNKHVGWEKAIEIYERAVIAIPHSVDLWTYYATFFAEKSSDVEAIRSLFERAVSIVGPDYLAHVLWDKYIEFERSQEDMKSYVSILRRIVAIPLRDIQRYWEALRQILYSYTPTELLSTEDFAAIRSDLRLLSTADEVLVLGEVRKRVLELCEIAYKNSLVDRENREAFEMGVKRFYFHVKPLDDSQLENWRQYLSFEISEGNESRIVKLFERCLIPCAKNSEFWIRYADFLFHRDGNTDAAKSVLLRATQPFVEDDPEIYLAIAQLEDTVKQTTEAHSAYQRAMTSSSPGQVEAVIRFAHFYRRHGDVSSAIEVFRQGLDTAKNDSSFAYISVELARVQSIFGDDDGAKQTYEEAVKRAPHSRGLWIAYANYEIKKGGDDLETRVIELFERGLRMQKDSANVLEGQNRAEVLRHYSDFLLCYGTDIHRLNDVESELRGLVPASSKMRRKRARPEDVSAPPAKVPRVVPQQQ